MRQRRHADLSHVAVFTTPPACLTRCVMTSASVTLTRVTCRPPCLRGLAGHLDLLAHYFGILSCRLITWIDEDGHGKHDEDVYRFVVNGNWPRNQLFARPRIDFPMRTGSQSGPTSPGLLWQ